VALLLELNHRINNELASVINLVSVAAVRAVNSEVKAALSDIVELLHEHAEVHRVLKMPSRDTLIDAADHLAKLCFAMSRSRLDRMNIHLLFAADPLRLQSERVAGDEIALLLRNLSAEDRSNIIALKSARQELSDAILIAEKAASGKALGGGLMNDDGKLKFVVVVVLSR
jgi:hypothetical protein